MISQRTKNLRANMEKLGVDVDSIWDKSQIYCYKPLFIDDFPIKNLYNLVYFGDFLLQFTIPATAPPPKVSWIQEGLGVAEAILPGDRHFVQDFFQCGELGRLDEIR